jgi:hypothetical protein
MNPLVARICALATYLEQSYFSFSWGTDSMKGTYSAMHTAAAEQGLDDFYLKVTWYDSSPESMSGDVTHLVTPKYVTVPLTNEAVAKAFIADLEALATMKAKKQLDIERDARWHRLAQRRMNREVEARIPQAPVQLSLV